MTSDITTPVVETRKRKRSNEPEPFTYQIEVIDFDGDSYDMVVEAESYQEASSKAESICSSRNITINYLNIYKF